jgi:hypothetical protein
MRETVVISPGATPPHRAATLLIARHGAAAAHQQASRELRETRRARSRKRFAFWATVVAEIDAQYETGLAAPRPGDSVH